MNKIKNRVFIKGFDKDLKCRGFQFEVGKDYKINNPKGTKLELCTNTVFHFCDSLQKVHGFYSCREEENNRFCIIEVLGKFIEDSEKCGSDHIKIVREIVGEELKIAKGLTGGNTGLFNNGYRNNGDLNNGYLNNGYRNNGDLNNGYLNNGYRNNGDLNNGDRNNGNLNNGDLNNGNRNNGDLNNGYLNNGYRNNGDLNNGNQNNGNQNNGDLNNGDRNNGIFNKTDNSNGVFCNIEPKICIFNIQTDWTLREFYDSKYWDAICSSYFDLTEWVEDKKVIENGASGKLVVNSYKNTCRKWWKNMTQENKEIIKSMPNFNVKVFCDITGIKKEEV